MKRYIKPETEITVISACKMMCTSPSINNGEGNGTQLTKERESVDFSIEDSWK